MKKIFGILVILLPLILLTGCIDYRPGYQPDYNTQKGDEEMNEMTNQLDSLTFYNHALRHSCGLNARYSCLVLCYNLSQKRGQ